MISSADARRLSASIARLLSSDSIGDPERWRSSAARELVQLVGADGACVALETSSPRYSGIDLDDSAVREYAEYYAGVDAGIARQRELSLTHWSRASVWPGSSLQRSEYYNDFARPHGLLDALGIAAIAPGRRVRVSLMFSARLSENDRTTARRLLRLALPAFRAGALLSFRLTTRHETLSRIIDRSSQPLALCTVGGRVVHRNPALVEAESCEPRGGLLDTIEQLAPAVYATDVAVLGVGSLVKDVLSPSGRWRVIASRLELEPGVESPLVLVALVARASVSEVTEELRNRFRLTGREVEVVRLLRLRRSNAEIASTLRISEHTARHHTESILLKTGLHSRTQIERYFSRRAFDADSQSAPEPFSTMAASAYEP